MNTLKKRIIFDLALSWIIFIALFAIITIESSLEYSWTTVTNALWIVGMIALAFFIGRGFYRLTKYWKGER